MGQENAQRLIQENNLGPGANVIIDASGAEPSIKTAIHMLRMGSSYMQGGMGCDEIIFPIVATCIKELTVQSSFGYGSGDYQTALDMVAAEKINVKKLVSRKVTFEEAELAFQDVKKGKGIKPLIAKPHWL